MKYKNLKSFAHNFTHSFISYENYVDGIHIVEELRDIARLRAEEPMFICWLPKFETNAGPLSDPARKSIRYYRERLTKHAENHRIELALIRNFRAEFHLLPSKQLKVESILVDDRGKEYRQSVAF